MRIAIFMNEEYDFMFDMLKELVPRLKSEYALDGVIFFPGRLTKYRGIKIYITYLKIFGVPVFFKLFARSAIKRFYILKSYFMKRSPFYSFKGICRHHRIENFKAETPNSDSVVRWVREKQVDIILVFVGDILKKQILDAPRIGVLNKHAGLLPAYKGVFPVFWSMMDRAPIGLTIHKVNEEIDSGDIVLQRVYDNNSAESVYDYYRLIYKDTPDLILKSLELLRENSNKKYPHEMKESYFGLPTRDDYRRFRQMGHSFA